FLSAARQKSRFSRNFASISDNVRSPQSSAVSAARWEKLGACETTNSFNCVARAAKSQRATSHPSRHPVMQYVFEKDCTTITASSRVASFKTVGAGVSGV